jgi:hypothetical protein
VVDLQFVKELEQSGFLKSLKGNESGEQTWLDIQRRAALTFAERTRRSGLVMMHRIA